MKLITIYDVLKDQSFLVEAVRGEETLDALRAAVQQQGSDILLPLLLTPSGLSIWSPSTGLWKSCSQVRKTSLKVPPKSLSIHRHGPL